jgi:23S rRNA (adenine2503-C2)-methyltransferase
MPAPQNEVKVNLKQLDEAGLVSFATKLGQPPYRGRQLFRWVHGAGAASFDEMTDLPRTLRTRLSEVARIDPFTVLGEQRASDGTRKIAFDAGRGDAAESVLIPDFDDAGRPRRLTICVSSQVGCAMGCTFCATGQMGFRHNLDPGKIVDQVRYFGEAAVRDFGRPVSNVVFMGMGEPLQNYRAVLQSIEILASPNGLGMAPRRITVSTVGLAGRIRQLADDDPGCLLAVSLHAPSDAKRSAIMPVNRGARTDLSSLRSALAYYHERTRRPVTYEYCLFRGFNDSPADAKQLAEVSRWIPSKVNVIMYNPVEGVAFERTNERELNRFVKALVSTGVAVTVRRSRGQDISAACGQLATQGRHYAPLERDAKQA